METEDLVVDEGGQWKVVEEVGKVFPDIGIAVFSKTFVVEAVYLGNLSGFVVATQDGDTVTVSHFESYEQCNGLDRVVASVDVVTHEEVIGIGRVATNAEEF